MVLGHFVERQIAQTGHFIDRIFHRQDISQIGHFIDRTFHRQDISQIGHNIERQCVYRTFQRIGYFIDIEHFLDRTFHRFRNRTPQSQNQTTTMSSNQYRRSVFQIPRGRKRDRKKVLNPFHRPIPRPPLQNEKNQKVKFITHFRNVYILYTKV